MLQSMRWSATFVVAAPLLVACSGASPSGPEGGFAIATSPLTLDGVEDACYDLAIYNRSGALVWSRERVCADRYGDLRSAIGVVGTCDASEGESPNRVELVLEGLYDGGGERLEDYADPTASGPLVLERPCVANTDTEVAFDVNVMRAAKQGFTDITVAFEDVFCSAKIDCDSNTTLWDPESGLPVETAVIGLACTAGKGADTHLYWSRAELVCDGDPLAIGLVVPPGNMYSTSSPAPAPFAQVATYQGVESLHEGGTLLGKVFFNLAFGLRAGASATCSLVMHATVSDGALDDCTTPGETTYPVIEVATKRFVLDGEFACGADPLDDEAGVGVWARYTERDETVRFALEAHRVDDVLAVESCGFCGDGIRDEGVEQCDPPSADLDCAYGESSCARCDADCNTVPGTVVGFCGDGVTQGEEEDCDPPSADLDCAYGEASCARCDGSCHTTSGNPVGFCGDTVVQAPQEGCDPPSGTTECAPGEATCTQCDATCQPFAGTAGPPITPLTLPNGAPSGCVPQTGSSEHCVVAKVSCDDDCEVWLDGALYHAFEDEPWWVEKTIALSGLDTGCHVLGVRTRDVHNVAAGFVGTISVDGAGPGDEGFYVTAQTDAITVNDVAPADGDGDTWCELDYDNPDFATAVQCSDIDTWNAAPWNVWGHRYYELMPDPAYPIWYNAACAGEHTEAFARIVFTVPDVDVPSGVCPVEPVCGNGVLEDGEACDPPDDPSTTCPEGQTCTGCSALCEVFEYVTDSCDGFPTTFTGNTVLFGYAKPTNIDKPECITTIVGNVLVMNAFPASGTVWLPRLETINDPGAGVAQLTLNEFPHNVALFPALREVESMSVTAFGNKTVNLPMLEGGPGGAQLSLQIGNTPSTIYNMPATRGVTIVSQAANSTFNLGTPTDLRFTAQNNGIVLNLGAGATTATTIQAISFSSLTVNAPGLTSVTNLSVVGNFASATGFSALTSIGPSSVALTLTGTASLPHVTSITSTGNVTWSPGNAAIPELASVSAPQLRLVGAGTDNLGAITLPSTLTTVSGVVLMQSGTTLTGAGLSTIGGLNVSNNFNLVTLSLPELDLVNGIFTVRGNASLENSMATAILGALDAPPTGAVSICGNLNGPACP